jgi:hypothetical protein
MRLISLIFIIFINDLSTNKFILHDSHLMFALLNNNEIILFFQVDQYHYTNFFLYHQNLRECYYD